MAKAPDLQDAVKEKKAAEAAALAEKKKANYTPERIDKFWKGELTIRELEGMTGPEMLSIAMIGFQMYEAGKFEEAKTIFNGLAALDSKESYYLTALGAVYLAQEDLANAKDAFDKAIKLNPKEIASYVNRGEVYLRTGKLQEAAQDFKSAVDLDPQGKDPLANRARVLAGAALQMIQEAQAKAGKPISGPPVKVLNRNPGGKAAGKADAKPAAKKK